MEKATQDRADLLAGREVSRKRKADRASKLLTIAQMVNLI
jgi:hypothetical protein